MVRQRHGSIGSIGHITTWTARWASVVWMPFVAAGMIARTTRLIVASTGDDMVVGDLNEAEDTTILFTDPGDTSSPIFLLTAANDIHGEPSVNGVEAYAGGTGTGLVGIGDGNNDATGVIGFGSGTGPGVEGDGGDDNGNGPGVAGFGGRQNGPGVTGRGGGGLESNADGVQGFGFGKGVGVVGHDGLAGATGVLGFGGLNGQGVAGIGIGTAPGVVGVAGDFTQRVNADGVQGYGAGAGVGVAAHGGASNGAGALGFGGGRLGQGVAGIGADGGPGVVGVGGNFKQDHNADGVQGFGAGVFSGVAGFGGAKNGTGVFGAGGGPDGAGVHGQGTGRGPGVIGTTAGNHAVIGMTTRVNFGGVFGLATTPGTAGIYGSTLDANTGKNVATAYAGYFDGTMVVVNGTKSAAVPHADGSHRLLYCMESPESWFEDFGEARLTRGRAEVRLDPEFAAVVQTDGYHVFLTPHSAECETLAVTERRADAFVVTERGKGTSNETFSWRLVAKRKDVTAERLARVQLPQASALPEVPVREATPPAPHHIAPRAIPAAIKPPVPPSPSARPRRRVIPTNGA